MFRRSPVNPARRRWWLFGIALALLLVGDLLATLWAASTVGVRREANPVMRVLLRQGPGAIVLGHLVVGGVALLAFDRLVAILRSLERAGERRLAIWCERWLLGLICLGIVIICNNLLVVAAGSA